MDNKKLTPWMQEAAEITSGDRMRDYGRSLLNFLRIAIYWSLFLGITVTPDKAAWLMVLMKASREQQTPKDDNGVDGIGYLSCLSDMDSQMKELGYTRGYHAFQDMTLIGMQALLQSLENRNGS